MSTDAPDSRPRYKAATMHSSKRSRPFAIPGSSFMNTTSTERVGGEESLLAVGDRPYAANRPRASSVATGQSLGRTPARSFYYRTFHGQLQPVHYSSEGLREQTAELASYAISDNTTVPEGIAKVASEASEDEEDDIIREVSEAISPIEPQRNRTGESSRSKDGEMTHTTSSKRFPGKLDVPGRSSSDGVDDHPGSKVNERSPLLDAKRTSGYSVSQDIEDQKAVDNRGPRPWHVVAHKARSCTFILLHPKSWSGRSIWREAVVHPVSLLPAVFLGLLLNILDALSYGMILFPTGNQVFNGLGVDGISMFYVSTIVAQVVYSAGGSIFRGGIGSEMIEVVPFFHSMATAILNHIGQDNPKSVLATTILAFAMSSVITGLVFFLMGACKLGSLIGFFPRHILIGCIGGVGWFLVKTGIVVSARLPGSLVYSLATLKQLFRVEVVPLWITPLGIAIVLLIIQRFYKSNFLVGGYFIAVAIVFYIVKFAAGIEMATLRSHGWVFDTPAAGKPWYSFYTLFDFKEVNWQALAQTIPAMFALTFFGVLHVPINVPALGLSIGEDNLNIDRELIAHGISNCVSGLFGSIQNYLAYTNSLLFIDSGGNDRLAGLLLAVATFGIMLVGPVIIGYIPVMVVGALIFLLGIELLEEAVVDPFGKLHRLEYITILIIVVTMGIYDFVVGILVGIVLAALSYVVQTSRRTAIRATYSGEIAQSTVRRPPMQLKFLKETGKQIFIIKLAGFLFFGTIVGVENRIRSLLSEDVFSSQPLRFLVLDMAHINGIDFSAAEAFTRINRLLQKKGVQLVVSGLELEGEVGRALQAVGLLNEEAEVKVFETLNQALENCENKLLTALYRQQEIRKSRRLTHLDVPQKPSTDLSSSYKAEFLVSSPRRSQLHRAATATLEDDQTSRQKWHSFKQPLPLLLQIFEEFSEKNEDFWHRAVPYFERIFFPRGSVVFQVGDRPNSFYMVEEGIMRAEYELPQGNYAEVVVAGRPCGELPFFTDTPRTANMTAEKDCVVWQLTGPKWKDIQSKDPEVAQELLKICLKLTKERIDVITSYILTTAG